MLEILGRKPGGGFIKIENVYINGKVIFVTLGGLFIGSAVTNSEIISVSLKKVIEIVAWICQANINMEIYGVN
jgi:hypothetical protein